MSQQNGHTQEGSLWGARFASGPAPALKDISRSPDYYFRLLPQDIAGCRAHCRELGRVGLLKSSEVDLILSHLAGIEQDWLDGTLERSGDSEDVHGFIEEELINRAGPVGGKLRAGRSRNDQTANDLRLFLLEEARIITEETIAVVTALISQATEHTDTVCPGFTHLQSAQPITFGHQLLAHAQPLVRDLDRLRNWQARHSVSPLGAAALAGSGVVKNTDEMATELGYMSSFENSIDAVSGRDHVTEFMFVIAQLMTHISRFAEEQIMWASQQFGWIKLDDSWSTGSSIMPQKKNPDIAELSRGKAGTMLGLLTGMLAIQKSLPFAYNRDLFEDKYAVFHTVDLIHLVLPALAGSIQTMHPQADVMKNQAGWGYSTATEVADYLSKNGVPFRESHEIVGELVRHCEQQGITIAEIDEVTLRSIDSRINVEFIRSSTPLQAVLNKNAKGATHPDRVRDQITALQERLNSFSV